MDLKNGAHQWGLIAAVIVVGLAGLYFYTNRPQAEEKTSMANSETQTAPAAEPATNKVSVAGAVFKTSLGDIELALFPDKAPKTVANFVELAGKGFYNDTKFHRIIKDFMIQGGDPLSKDDSQQARWGTGGPGYQFEDEINDQKLVKGMLAMANAGPGTNGSQFFIVTAQATPWLDGHHTVFGKVVKGMDIVNKIGVVATGAGDVPKAPVVIKEVILK